MHGGVRWLSNGPGSGYGNVGEDYISALLDAGVEVSWTPLGWPSDTWPAHHGPVRDLARHRLTGARHAGLAHREIEHDAVVVHAPPVWHDEIRVQARGRALIACTTWETDRLPVEWVPVLNRYDRVIVPSHFNRRTFAASGVAVPIDVVPHLVPAAAAAVEPGAVAPAAVEPDASAPEVSGDVDLRRRWRRSEDGFVFYTVATWLTRKAIPDLIEAFLTAFTGRDDVTLVIHTGPEDRIAGRALGVWGETGRPLQAGTPYAVARQLAGRSDPARIALSTLRESRSDVCRLHEQGDCFVTLSRGEGFGLGPFEAGAAGTPSILTGWGGSLDYLPDGYPYLVDFDLIPTADDVPDEWWWPRAGEHWAQARIEHAAELMRHVVTHRDEARRWGGRLQRHLLGRYAPAAVVESLLGALDRTS